jgi:HAD superfamily hydrolase (TIGR01509 family)
MSRVQAVVFDMDGLLVDSEPLWQEARIAAFGADRLRWTDADQQQVMGSATDEWAAFLAERLEHAYSLREIVEFVLAEMEKAYRQRVPLLPGAERVVAETARAYPIAIASGSPRRLVSAVLDGAGWREQFSVVVCSDDVRRGKPAPDAYLEAASRLGVAPEALAVLEDSGNGILAGRAAGAYVIAVPNHYARPDDHLLQKADRVLGSLDQFALDMLP